MFMPELGTTLLRNRLALIRAAAGFLLLVGVAGAKSTTQSTPGSATAPKGSSTTTIKAGAPDGPAQQPPSSGNQPINQPPAPNQAPANQAPATNQPANGQSSPAGSNPGPDQSGGQAPSANDNGVFVFRAEAREVTLHATVVDDKNHLV